MAVPGEFKSENERQSNLVFSDTEILFSCFPTQSKIRLYLQHFNANSVSTVEVSYNLKQQGTLPISAAFIYEKDGNGSLVFITVRKVMLKHVKVREQLCINT